MKNNTMKDLRRFEITIYDYLEERRRQELEEGRQIDLKRIMETLHEYMENVAIDFAADYNMNYEPVYK